MSCVLTNFSTLASGSTTYFWPCVNSGSYSAFCFLGGLSLATGVLLHEFAEQYSVSQHIPLEISKTLYAALSLIFCPVNLASSASLCASLSLYFSQSTWVCLVWLGNCLQGVDQANCRLTYCFYLFFFFFLKVVLLSYT